VSAILLRQVRGIFRRSAVALATGGTRLNVSVTLLAIAALVGTLALSAAPALASPEVEITPGCGLQPAGTLCGVVNPQRTTVTQCAFEYGPTPAYESFIPCSPATPYTGAAPIEVTAAPTGLEANTTYYYRLVIVDEGAVGHGEGEEFTTASVPPTIEDVSATAITDDNATLEAQIGPVNSETQYEVILADPCVGPSECIRDVPLVSGKIPATRGHETVKVELASKEHLEIEPSTIYAYWVVAKNSEDQATEVHETFTTQKAESSPGGSGGTSDGGGTNGGSGSTGAGTGTDTGANTGTSTCPNNVAVPPACGAKELEGPRGKFESRPLTRAQKLAKALLTCRKDEKRARRLACEKMARTRYSPAPKKKAKDGKK